MNPKLALYLPNPRRENMEINGLRYVVLRLLCLEMGFCSGVEQVHEHANERYGLADIRSRRADFEPAMGFHPAFASGVFDGLFALFK